MKLVIPGIPHAKARPRMTRSGVVYDTQYKEKQFVRLLLKNALTMALKSNDTSIVDEAKTLTDSDCYELQLVFHMPLNESDSEANTNLKLWGIIPCNKKPDIDNLEKFILDCANKVLFDDDHMIVKLSSKKIYSNQPRTEINIMASKDNYEHESKTVFKTFSPDKFQELMNHFKNISMLSPDYLDKIPEDQKKEWMKNAASLIARFSCKYALDFRKIQRDLNKKSFE